jgi:hypothetical protein
MSNDDFSHYLQHIALLDMPLECKIELLRVVQDIMRSFVDRAFGEDSVQLARKDGDEIKIARAGDSSPVVGSKDHTNTGDKALTDAFTTRAGREK